MEAKIRLLRKRKEQLQAALDAIRHHHHPASITKGCTCDLKGLNARVCTASRELCCHDNCSHYNDSNHHEAGKFCALKVSADEIFEDDPHTLLDLSTESDSAQGLVKIS